MTRPSPPASRRPVTFPLCPHCDEPLRPARVSGNHDRPAILFKRCDDCGHEQDHVVEPQADEVPA